MYSLYDMVGSLTSRISLPFCIILQYVCCIYSEHTLCSVSMLVLHLYIPLDSLFVWVHICQSPPSSDHEVTHIQMHVTGTRLSTDGCSLAYGDFIVLMCLHPAAVISSQAQWAHRTDLYWSVLIGTDLCTLLFRARQLSLVLKRKDGGRAEGGRKVYSENVTEKWLLPWICV
jgi:hypothetical protein